MHGQAIGTGALDCDDPPALAGRTSSRFLGGRLLGLDLGTVAELSPLIIDRDGADVDVDLVGATDDYVRRPFVIEGAAQGAIGASLAMLLLGVLYLVVRSHVDARLVALLGTEPSFLPWPIVLSTVLLGAVLGVVAAFLSLRRFVSS